MTLTMPCSRRTHPPSVPPWLHINYLQWTICIVVDNPLNKRKGGHANGAMPSPVSVRKKNPPASLPTQSPRRSVFIATAVSFAAAVDRPVGAIDFDASPTSIVERVYKVSPPPVKIKSPSSRTIVKIGHIPRTKFIRFVRGDHHYKPETK